jgi:shikimate dehydrogenase
MSAAVDGTTRLLGVMGWPVAHSLSPAMHNVVLHRLGLNWCYLPLPVPPARVAEAVQGAAALGFRGVNVTVPHKQSVMAGLDEITPEARAVGAVNTIVISRREDGKAHLSGHNTDVLGFTGSLRAGGFEPAESRLAWVVGAGGSARAVVYGLLAAGCGEVIVLNRTESRAEQLVADLGFAGEGRLRAAALESGRLVALAKEADLLVNTTTLGMWPTTERSIWPEGPQLPASLTVYDLVYNPLETQLLSQTRRAGARAIDGLGMLARQGALALELWLDDPLDVAWATGEMREVCALALQTRTLSAPTSRDA